MHGEVRLERTRTERAQSYYPTLRLRALEPNRGWHGWRWTKLCDHTLWQRLLTGDCTEQRPILHAKARAESFEAFRERSQ
jgi:hypothetical protein